MQQLRVLRTKAGLPLKEAGRLLGLSESALSLYENGKRQPDYATLMKIADFFSVSVDELLGRPGAAVKVPVLGEVRAGMPEFAEEQYLDYEDVTIPPSERDDYFALKVRGDSMEPKFTQGDILIVRRQTDAEQGAFVVAMVGEDSATVKILHHTPTGLILSPTNPKYEPMYFTKEEVASLPVRIIGRVMELRSRF